VSSEAPSAETSRRIKSLIGEGLPFTLAYYPGAEHGMTLFESGADGERISTRYAPGYFSMIRDFARDGRLHGSYGDRELTAPAKSPVASGLEVSRRSSDLRVWRDPAAASER